MKLWPLFALGALAIACDSPAEPGAYPPSWTVAIDGKTSTLLGTMHAEVDVSALAPDLMDTLKGARVLVTEADVRTIDQDAFLEAVALPPGTTIRAAVSAQDFEAISRAVAPFTDDETANGLQPWFLEGQAVLARLPPGIDPIDTALVREAEDAGVSLAFFETWQQQVALLNGLGFDDGLAVLLQTARAPDAAVDAHLQWAAAYEAGDVDQMTALAFDADAMQARPAFYDDVVFRHDGWMPQLIEQLERGDAFIATGFMHMLTDRGLLALLEARGFSVTLR